MSCKQKSTLKFPLMMKILGTAGFPLRDFEQVRMLPNNKE